MTKINDELMEEYGKIRREYNDFIF